jgi:hypothetical protein
MQLLQRQELRDTWTLVVCLLHCVEHGRYLVEHGFQPKGMAPDHWQTCTFCLSGDRVIDEIEVCTCVKSPRCPAHRGWGECLS